MTTLTRTASRTGRSAWSSMIFAQVILLTITRMLIARIRKADPSSDDGLTTAEYVIMLVIGIPIVVAIALLLYNHFKSDAQQVVNQQ